MLQAIGRWQNRSLAGCFTTWQQWQRQQAGRRIALQKTMQRWQAQRLAAALDGWRAAASDAVRLRGAAASALQLFRNAALGKAFRSWQAVAQYRQVRPQRDAVKTSCTSAIRELECLAGTGDRATVHAFSCNPILLLRA